ncbi:Cyanate hydratase [Coemansia spiralis]|uniref:Cyanate hydratase n=2 Tax=Coemansia TaxID=4863 RepID=A0A9W8FXM6_9FUNG|nr:cyanate hydratase [Coemansia spiralis]KAJ1987117.1 Cyanate hydratase [Coemansia umbellata]KAJ2619051.1 Cyanate hydratase [Coemansia sp. RSA 1358]KAJ2669840.1 Cyanate hydratase [Coemansia spiralis]
MDHTEAIPLACTKLLHEKARQKLTFAQIAEHISHDEVWTAALFYGRASPSLKDIQMLAHLLNLSAETLEEDFRMSGPPQREVNVPGMSDPIVHPFQEAIALYAPAIRSVVTEKLGDGAVSAPNMKLRIEKNTTSKGSNEIKLILESKYILYQSW